MQYKVPQDVQREDTIIGPLTLRHMAILGGGGGIAYFTYISLSETYLIQVWLPPVLVITVITLSFAFLKINSLPFHEFLMNFIEYHLLAKKRFWIQGTGDAFVPPYQPIKNDSSTKITEPKKQTKSLAELTKVLDSHGKSGIIKTYKK